MFAFLYILPCNNTTNDCTRLLLSYSHHRLPLKRGKVKNDCYIANLMSIHQIIHYNRDIIQSHTKIKKEITSVSTTQVTAGEVLENRMSYGAHHHQN